MQTIGFNNETPALSRFFMERSFVKQESQRLHLADKGRKIETAERMSKVLGHPVPPQPALSITHFACEVTRAMAGGGERQVRHAKPVLGGPRKVRRASASGGRPERRTKAREKFMAHVLAEASGEITIDPKYLSRCARLRAVEAAAQVQVESPAKPKRVRKPAAKKVAA